MSEPIKVRDASQKFKDFLKSKNKASATILAYGKDIDQLISFLEDLKREHVHEVTSDDIQSFLVHMQGKGYTPKSVSRKLNSTRTFYRFLKVNEYITDDPSLIVKHPKYELNPPRVLSPLEYRALRDSASSDPRIYAIIEVLLQTGIRIGELANLRSEDLKDNELSIRPYEGHPARVVPLNKRSREALKRYLAARPTTSDDHLFVTKTGKPFLVRNIRDAIERYFRKAGIENAKINDLRHTFVAHHLKNGVSIVYLSKVLGHKRLSSTERYLQYLKEVKNGEGTSLMEL
ncbi:MAG TPA: tyrosine-type recombinase/integrase [Patescibacteria group bacterium]|nr:tyrosine-type recombinase/integrase [Patescibacteria group bacterium]